MRLSSIVLNICMFGILEFEIVSKWWGCSLVVECMFCMCEVLGLIFGIFKVVLFLWCNGLVCWIFNLEVLGLSFGRDVYFVIKFNYI